MMIKPVSFGLGMVIGAEMVTIAWLCREIVRLKDRVYER